MKVDFFIRLGDAYKHKKTGEVRSVYSVALPCDLDFVELVTNKPSREEEDELDNVCERMGESMNEMFLMHERTIIQPFKQHKYRTFVRCRGRAGKVDIRPSGEL